jgi:hypothetical protein
MKVTSRKNLWALFGSKPSIHYRLFEIGLTAIQAFSFVWLFNGFSNLTYENIEMTMF